jgi:TonB family protein
MKNLATSKVFFLSLLCFLFAMFAAQGSAQQRNGDTLAGTFWAGANSDKDSFVLELLKDQSVLYTSAKGTTSKGSWKRVGNDLSIVLNRGFTKLKATIVGKQLTGDAINRKGSSWNWTAIKQEAFVVSQDAPPYPPLAKAARIEKTVRVEVQIDFTGSVSSTKVIEGHPLLNPVCEASAKKWKFNASPEASGLRLVILSFTFQIPAKIKSWEKAVDINYLSKYQAEIKAGVSLIEKSHSTAASGR